MQLLPTIQDQIISVTPKSSLKPECSQSPLTASAQSNHWSASVFINWPFLDISLNGVKQFAVDRLCLPSLSIMLPCYSLYWYFTPFHCCIVFHCIHSPVDGCLDCFPFGVIRNYFVMDINVHISMWAFECIAFTRF